MQEIITQATVLAGTPRVPVAGATRYQLGPAAVGVLLEATEDRIEAFERAELEYYEAVAPQMRVLQEEGDKRRRRLLASPDEVDALPLPDSLATMRASFEEERLKSRMLQAKAEAAVRVEGAAWEDLRGKVSRKVLEVIALDFLSTYEDRTSAPPPSSTASAPEGDGLPAAVVAEMVPSPA